MSNRHSDNGSTFSKATYKASRPGLPSSERRRAELEQATRNAARERRFWQMAHNDPVAWIKEYFKGYFKK
jgi:hypothetical protein